MDACLSGVRPPGRGSARQGGPLETRVRSAGVGAGARALDSRFVCPVYGYTAAVRETVGHGGQRPTLEITSTTPFMRAIRLYEFARYGQRPAIHPHLGPPSGPVYVPDIPRPSLATVPTKTFWNPGIGPTTSVRTSLT